MRFDKDGKKSWAAKIFSHHAKIFAWCCKNHFLQPRKTGLGCRNYWHKIRIVDQCGTDVVSSDRSLYECFPGSPFLIPLTKGNFEKAGCVMQCSEIFRWVIKSNMLPDYWLTKPANNSFYPGNEKIRFLVSLKIFTFV